MNILIIGSGGREHALAWKLAQSPRVKKIFCAPGNGGTARLGPCVPIRAGDIHGLLAFALENKVDLTVAGTEESLALGLADAFARQGLRVFGPTQAAARLESSKIFAKEFMARHHIPTAAHRVFTDPGEARAYAAGCPYPLVLKADGLAAGKGVYVCHTPEEARQAVTELMEEKKFGEAGAGLVAEEFLRGREVSVLAFCDGETLAPLISARDYKRAGDRDTGPNTGGMGCVAPCEYYPPVAEQCRREIFEPTLRGLRAENLLYRGVLYFGLMIVEGRPLLLEYNARFGDPEAQVILPLLENDLPDILEACAAGTLAGYLAGQPLRWRPGAAVCVVAASKGYPGEYQTGFPITDPYAEVLDTHLFHAGTALEEGEVVTAGGRVLCAVGLGTSSAKASWRAYGLISQIKFANKTYRSDIG